MDPILLDIPMPITTPRLSLRPPMAGDGRELNAAIGETLEQLKPWMPWAQAMPTVEDSEENVRRAQAKWILREDLRLTIFDRATGAYAGGTGLHRIDWEARRFEIGYWVRTRFSGMGYITESTLALTRFAFEFLGARRVEIRCDSTNARSAAVPRRLGFELEGTLRAQGSLPNGSASDTLVFARLNATGLPGLDVGW